MSAGFDVEASAEGNVKSTEWVTSLLLVAGFGFAFASMLLILASICCTTRDLLVRARTASSVLMQPGPQLVYRPGLGRL